jgi:hypothetical protein
MLSVEVNSTFGTSEIWRAHPMNSPVTLKVIFFLLLIILEKKKNIEFKILILKKKKKFI